MNDFEKGREFFNKGMEFYKSQNYEEVKILNLKFQGFEIFYREL